MGCVVHRRVDMAEAMGQRLLEIDPSDDSAYAMLANIYYSSAGKMDKMAKAWTAMRDRGVRKVAGVRLRLEDRLMCLLQMAKGTSSYLRYTIS